MAATVDAPAFRARQLSFIEDEFSNLVEDGLGLKLEEDTGLRSQGICPGQSLPRSFGVTSAPYALLVRSRVHQGFKGSHETSHRSGP